MTTSIQTNDSPQHQKTDSKKLRIIHTENTMIQKQKYPYKQVSLLVEQPDTIQKIIDSTHCKISIRKHTSNAPTPTATTSTSLSLSTSTSSSTSAANHKMIEITLEGTSDEIFNAHKEINHIRSHGHLMQNNQRTRIRFGNNLKKQRMPHKLNNWELDVTNTNMLQTVENIVSKSKPMNWAIFKFFDNDENNKENVKILGIDECGKGGIRELRSHLSNIRELKYILLRFDYGIDIERHQIILIIWSPSTARTGQKRNIIPILRHKSLIKQTLCATYEITISIHSHLHFSFILSELHSKNLVPEILLRVSKRNYNHNDSDTDNDENDNENALKAPPSVSLLKKTNAVSTPSVFNKNMDAKLNAKTLKMQHSTPNLKYSLTKKIFVAKDWTLKQLRGELGKIYKISSGELQITHIIYTLKQRPSRFNEPNHTERILSLNDDHKILSDLGLYHGSRIYITQISADDHKNEIECIQSAVHLAAERRARFTATKMSKTNKIKIKLKLSSHIHNKRKSLQSLRSLKNKISSLKNKPNVLRAVEQIEKNRAMPKKGRTQKAKSFVLSPKDANITAAAVFSAASTEKIKNGTTTTTTNKNEKGRQKIKSEIDEYASISATDIKHYRQPSLSDHELDEIEDDSSLNTVIAKSHTMPKMKLSRTRSLSTTLTEGLSNKIMTNVIDPEQYQEYTKPQIFESVVVEKQKSSTKKASTSPLPPPIIEVDEKEEKEKEKEKDIALKQSASSIADEYNILPLPSSSTSLHALATEETMASPTSPSTSSFAGYSEIECTLDLNDVFIVEKSIGRGKTAHVHYALYRDECDIALKEFRFGRLTDKILLDFHSELQTLKKLENPNICRLLGHYIDEKSKQLYLAFEWLPGGCLYDVVHDNNVIIEYSDVLEMSIDIARGMQYLHSKKIIHRDLKSHNLLLDEAYRVKITDFGTAKSLEVISGTTYTEVGTGGYCAPEVIEPPIQGYDRKVDVFSYGVLIWEIYHRANVFDQRCLRNMGQLRKGIRPKIDDKCPEEYKKLINDCWQFESKKRPNFDEIVQKLTQMYAKHNHK